MDKHDNRFKDIRWRDKLSFEEEKALIEDGSDEAIIKLIDNHLPQLLGIASKLTKGRTEILPDVVQEGCIGLDKASRTYDPEKGSFSTHAMWAIRSVLDKYIKEEIPTIRVPRATALKKGVKVKIIPLDKPIQLQSAPPFTLEEKLLDDARSPREVTYLKDSLEAVAKAFMKLPEREQYCIKEVVVDGRPLRDVAVDMGMSGEAVRLIKNKGLDKLRRFLELEGFESTFEVFGSLASSDKTELVVEIIKNKDKNED
jgi:RNA polymerase sigma factor (sigma-70 family)